MAAARPRIVSRRDAGIEKASSGAAASASGVGNGGSSRDRRPAASHQRPRRCEPATVRAPATDTCWPIIGPDGRLDGVDTRRRPPTGHATHERRHRRIDRACRIDRRRIAVEIEQPADPLHRGCEVRRRLQFEACRSTWSACARNVAIPAPPGSASDRRYVSPSHDSTPGMARSPTNEITAPAANGARTASRNGDADGRGRPLPARTPAGRPAERRRRGGEHLTHRVVELADTAKAGRKGDVGRTTSRSSRRAPGRCGHGGHGRSRAGRRRASSVSDPVEMPFAVPETASEPGHAVALDHTVGDETHRPGDDVVAGVPLRRAGRRIRSTPLARPEPVRPARQQRSGRSRRWSASA